MKSIARLLLLTGAAGVVSSAFLPWVTVEGRPLNLDLDLIGGAVTPGGKTVSGTETSVWPALAGVGGAVAVLTVLNLARKLLLLLGFVITLAGGGLLYYVLNVIDIETSGRTAVEQIVAGAVVTSSTGAGPPLLIASGVAVFLGALMR